MKLRFNADAANYIAIISFLAIVAICVVLMLVYVFSQLSIWFGLFLSVVVAAPIVGGFVIGTMGDGA